MTSLDEFISTLKSSYTKKGYKRHITEWLEDPVKFIDDAKSDRRQVEDFLIGKIISERERLSGSSLATAINAIKSFMEFEEVELNWKRVKRTIPKVRHVGADRPPTIDEIRMLLEVCNIRARSIVLIMVSSGCRVGAFDYFCLKDYQRLPSGVGSLVIYRGSLEEHRSFLSPEACDVLDKYLQSRIRVGEEMDRDSPLIRDVFDGDILRWKSNKNPKHFCGRSISYLMYKLWLLSGVKKYKKGRGDFKGAHGFRKFFKTRANQVMKNDDVEILMGHSLGVASSYYHPDISYLEKEYLKVVSLLTISEVAEVKREGEKIKRVQDKEISELKDSILKIMRRVDSVEKQLE